MKNKITIKDIALEAGVSPSLVSFVLSNASGIGDKHYSVNEKTAAKILEIVKKYNFTPSSVARNLRTNRSHTIGVIFTDISNSFFSNMARHIENIADANNYVALFSSTDENPAKLKTAITRLVDRGVDGLIIVPCEGCEQTLMAMAGKSVPIVLADRSCANFPSVLLDNAKAAAMAVRSLYESGHKKIEMISYDMRVSNIISREQGYKDAMIGLGLSDNINIHYVNYFDLDNSIKKIMSSCNFNDIDAFIFTTYSIALSGFLYMYNTGLYGTINMDWVSFDESDSFKFIKQNIHFIRQPIKEFAEQSFDMIISLIEGKELEQKEIILQPEYV